MDERLADNRANWDDRAVLHAASPGYGVADLAADPAALSDVVRFDLPLLGDVAGLRGVHLQCHIGTDTLSLARLGADMTGLDFSSAALTEARRLAATAGVAIPFVEADVARAADVLPHHAFDLVYVNIGSLCWLPSIERWAAAVATLLAPGGRLFLRDGHPMLFTIDERVPEHLTVAYPYFETAEPLDVEQSWSYVSTDRPVEHRVTHEWNHGLGEVVTALLGRGLRLTGLVEHRSVPYEALPGWMTPGDDGEWRLAERPERLPLSYTLQAVLDPERGRGPRL